MSDDSRALSSSSLLRPSVVALVLANLVPLYGVLGLGWRVFPLLLLFWLENVVIGAFNVLRMLFARPADWWEKITLIPLFVVHYGVFTAVHGGFVVLLFGGSAPTLETDMSSALQAIRETHVLWITPALVASHGYSFLANYLYAGEYRHADPRTLMWQPYARVAVLHLTVLIGGFLMLALGSPVIGLVLLVALKIGIDVKAHLKEREKLADSGSG